MIKFNHITAAAFLSAALFTPIASYANESEPAVDSTLTVHVIDVGQGLAVLAQTDDAALLFDGGDRDTASFLYSYLQSVGVESLDYMIASHYDSDHIGGLVDVVKDFEVATIFGPDYIHDSALFETFLENIVLTEHEIVMPQVGEIYEFGEGTFTVLAPSEIVDDPNENSIAIRLDYGETSFIITGDAEMESEEAMLATGIDLKCDVLVAGHHGAATSSTWDFVEATLPEYVIFSCGLNNQYGHPDEDTLEKFQSIEAEIFRTDEQGTIIAESDGVNITWNTVPTVDSIRYSTTSLNIREQATTDSSVIGKLYAGDSISVLYEADGWARVLYNGTVAYAACDYLTDEYQIPETTAVPVVVQTQAPVIAATEPVPQQNISAMVWLSATGEKYHSINNCGRMNPAKARQIDKSTAEAQGYEACKKCW